MDESPGVGMRTGVERRQRDRRAASRSGSDRRSGDRRRKAAMGGLFMSALTLGGVIQQTQSRPPAPMTDTVDASKTLQLPPELAPKENPPADPDHAYDSIIQEAAAEYGVDPVLVRSVIKAESRFDPDARSGAGAEGLMQLMPILQKELGVKDPMDPRENIFGGTKYLSKLLERHDGNITLALASYNAGPRNVAKYKGVPPFKETRGYVRKINGYIKEAKAASAAPAVVMASADLGLAD
jgi:soluble lytic murein transglycosylase-like protein